MNAQSANKATKPADWLVSHDLVSDAIREQVCDGIIYEKRPAKAPDGSVVPGLYNAWIWLDNPKQYNSYTTEMVKGIILAFRAASNARDVVATVFTGLSAPAATPRNTPSTTPATPRNTASTSPFSTTWSPRSWNATSR